ncbi:putative dead box ATP-dependent RNA helicase [Schistosoma mansoni]|uniref:putative dead box ATP-dependent RNA helicase n=1 Tax=Schistosoma mansoni TaxID=6183 RepID=UPI00022DC460|nr:putative dead box ATP-dependent RNA helicase [Schistosoma mansoni]|eukprot:XP_018653384.1 putative dead box ATP-dependent RNA helicase [Schistosoma mansoni]
MYDNCGFSNSQGCRVEVMGWDSLNLPDYIVKALSDCGLENPTPIQTAAIPPALHGFSDVLGSAPTGSGKTLAFGIPLVSKVFSLKTLQSQTCEEESKINSVIDQQKYEVASCVKPCGKKKKRKKETDIYSGLDVIEELDVNTGEIRAVHSLGDPVTEDSETLPIIEPPVCLKPNLNRNRVYGLVLVPTRELAIQVTQHLRALMKYVDYIRIETIVGGISVDKQLRLLRRCPDILVATPGRLWHFIQQGEPHLLTLHSVNVVVVDEADRMIEANHFDDLRAIFNWLHSSSSFNNEGKEEEQEDTTHLKKTLNLKRKHKLIEMSDHSTDMNRVQRQTLIFSATLTFVHSGALKPGTGSKNHKLLPNNKNTMTKKIKLAVLREMFGLKKSAKVIDLSSNHSTDQSVSNPGLICKSTCPDTLSECRLLCPSQESKDIRLFWFIAFGRHLGSSEYSNRRCLIFLNSKSGVRRLAGVLRQLLSPDAFSVSGYPSLQYVNVLHADMVQKQRLRALERFQADPNGILLASDVAARGLDLASISWVIHFDVPRTAELYIHRSGRTARANRQGTSLLFISPNEITFWRRISVSLQRTNMELDDFTIQPTTIQLTISEQIVKLAKQIDIQEHRNSRKLANDNWFTKAAKDANILLDDDDDYNNKFDDDENISRKRNSSKKKLDITKPLKLELRQLIIVSRGKLLKLTGGQIKCYQRPIQTLSKVKLLKEFGTI